MRDRKVATRYAEALLRAAKEAGLLADCAESYAGVVAATAENRELVVFLASPQVPEKDKKDMLQSVFGGRVEPILLNFFGLLIDRNRIEILGDIGEVFAELVEADRGVIRARVVTAVALPADLEDGLRTRLSKLAGKSVIMEKKVDPKVIGGVCVTLGDRVIDGTVRTNLDRLRNKLGKTQVRQV